jgi:hypothetical protein
MKRYRVKVEAGFRVAFQGDGTPRTDVFAVTVTNLSDKKVRVTHFGAAAIAMARHSHHSHKAYGGSGSGC